MGVWRHRVWVVAHGPALGGILSPRPPFDDGNRRHRGGRPQCSPARCCGNVRHVVESWRLVRTHLAMARPGNPARGLRLLVGLAKGPDGRNRRRHRRTARRIRRRPHPRTARGRRRIQWVVPHRRVAGQPTDVRGARPRCRGWSAVRGGTLLSRSRVCRNRPSAWIAVGADVDDHAFRSAAFPGSRGVGGAIPHSAHHLVWARARNLAPVHQPVRCWGSRPHDHQRLRRTHGDARRRVMLGVG